MRLDYTKLIADIRDTESKQVTAYSDLEHTTRRQLAAAFRWAARLHLHESIANHFSATLGADSDEFLINPRGAHFSRIRASDLILTRAGDGAGDSAGDSAADGAGAAAGSATTASPASPEELRELARVQSGERHQPKRKSRRKRR